MRDVFGDIEENKKKLALEALNRVLKLLNLPAEVNQDGEDDNSAELDRADFFLGIATLERRQLNMLVQAIYD